MVVEKREQVFISSTFKDLVEERRAVTQTLLEADCFPAGMELFPASNDEKFDLIKRVIDLCDYYVVIVGGRYGSVDAKAQLSYTEMEFDYAVSRKKPVMGFLHGSPGKLSADRIELEADLRKKLDAFREKIEKRMVKYWHEPGDLAGQVALAIMQIRKTHPAEGWIRAKQAMTPETKAELAELRARVRELTSELESARREHPEGIDPTQLAQGDEVASIECALRFHYRDTLESGKPYSSSGQRATWNVTPTWNDLFKHVGPELMDETSEARMESRLSDLCFDLSYKELVEQENGEPRAEDGQEDAEGRRPVGAIYEAEITPDGFNDVKVQLTALGLIEKGTKRRPGSDTNSYWKLTSKGQQSLLRLRSIRRATLIEVASDKEEGDN